MKDLLIYGDSSYFSLYGHHFSSLSSGGCAVREISTNPVKELTDEKTTVHAVIRKIMNTPIIQSNIIVV